MDRLCDDLVEEILRRLPAKYLHRVGAAARRYNLIVLSPGFRARYWESHSPYLSGVFLQSDRPWRQRCRFSSATGRWEEKRIQPPPAIDVETYAPPFLGQIGTAYWIGYYPMDKLIAYNCLHHTIQVLPVPTRVHGTTPALNRCIGERQGGGLRYAHFDCWVFQVWDLQTGGVDGIEWKLVHQVGVMELAERNPEATALVTKPKYVECRIKANSLFSVLGFHPTADIIFLDVNGTVVMYSIEDGTTRYQCSHQYLHHDVFLYVHPAHPVEIPAIKKAPLELKSS